MADGLALAKALGACVTAVTVTDIFPTGPYSPIPFPATVERYEAAAAEGAAKILASAAEAAAHLGVICQTVHVKDRHRPRAFSPHSRPRPATWWREHPMAGAASRACCWEARHRRSLRSAPSRSLSAVDWLARGRSSE